MVSISKTDPEGLIKTQMADDFADETTESIGTVTLRAFQETIEKIAVLSSPECRARWKFANRKKRTNRTKSRPLSSFIRRVGRVKNE